MRLSTSTLPMLPARIRRPAFDRAAVRTGIVHLGGGAFHRAHQAVVLDDPLAPRLRALAAAAGPVAARLVPVLIGVRELFGEDLPRDPRFRAAVETALDRLLARGVRRTLAGRPAG
ncbi:hypothetical protein U1T56_12570 [Geminicoccaceae bacterium SYSU G07066]|uniref:Mannitol dehydrogenase N-terminal domain-containing protein n=1 Tax=Benzoatithermus flavus TaxID=3108223 RepID=A0ABU8XSU8_9PROT